MRSFLKARKKIIWLGSLAFYIYVTGCKTLDSTKENSFKYSLLELKQDDRVMILAPHPDDESLATAGIIQRAKSLKLPIKLIFLTCGDNNQLSFLLYRKHPVLTPSAVRKMGEVRQNEALKAGEFLGLNSEEIIFLGYPDFGMLHIFLEYWDTNSPPFRSMLTRAQEVFYEKAYKKGSPYRAPNILSDIKELIKEFNPTIIFTSHPLDLNPDHQSLYAFTKIALMELEHKGELSKRVEVLPYLVHFYKWPSPKKMVKDIAAYPPKSLINISEWKKFVLSNDEIEKKQLAIKAHKSQYAYSASFMGSFVRKTEIFADLPIIKALEDSSLELIYECEDTEPPPAITEEKEQFIDIEKYLFRKEKDVFIFTLSLKKPIILKGHAYLYCFGISKQKPFVEMPKIRVKIGAIKHEIFDGNRQLTNSPIELTRKLENIKIKIPIALLGYPDSLLISASSYLDELPMDWTGWRFIILNN